MWSTRSEATCGYESPRTPTTSARPAVDGDGRLMAGGRDRRRDYEPVVGRVGAATPARLLRATPANRRTDAKTRERPPPTNRHCAPRGHQTQIETHIKMSFNKHKKMIFNINIDTINIESFRPAKCSRHVTYHLTYATLS